MLIAYLDESYEKDLYCIGAAIAEQSAWETVEDEFEKLRALNNEIHETPLDAEFHGHCIMGGTDDWTPLRGQHRQAAGVYKAALGVARDAGVKYIFRGLDVPRLNARYRYPHPPHQVVLGHLLERIDLYMQDVDPGGENCIVVADEIAEQAEHQRRFAEYQLVGTPGYRPSKLQRISAPISFASSRLSEGIQVADLATYMFRRVNVVKSGHPLAMKTQRGLWNIIEETRHHQSIWYP